MMSQDSSSGAQEQTALQGEVQRLRQGLADLQQEAQVCLHALAQLLHCLPL